MPLLEGRKIHNHRCTEDDDAEEREREREREREAKNDLRSRLNQEITDMKQAATTCREMSPAKMRHFKMSRPRGTETLANFLTN